jgi:hypothetical protein
MTAKSTGRGLAITAVLAMCLALAAKSWAQGMFYAEERKDGRIYVFAIGERWDTFLKTGGAEMGVAITRPGYGPDGETVVFDSEDAVNLYNFKHNLPGEYFPKPKEKPKSPYPAGKFSGLMFGDYYYFDKWHADQVSSSNNNSVEGQQGFWLRRIYLTYDYTFSEKFTTRFRIEMNSNGQFAGGNLNPYVKDAYLTWQFAGRQRVRLGIQPSLTFDSEEGFWGLRHIEKTPADLYKVDSSRDFGIALQGPLGDNGLSYAVQLANDSGNGSETDKYKVVRILGLYEPKGGLHVEAVYNFSGRANGQDRTTAKGEVGFKGKQFRVAGEYLYQKRNSGKAGVPDQKIGIWSGFGLWEFSPKRADLFFRFDSVKGDLGGKDTGLPGADGIDYVMISSQQPFKTYIFGLEYYLDSKIRISPNVEMVQYDNDPDPVKFPGRDQDRIFRVTFYWAW